MQYRTLPHGGEQISILGLGTSSIQFAEEKEIEETINLVNSIVCLLERQNYKARYCR